MEKNRSSGTTPEHFICPISLEVMKDPTVSKFGQNYDRESILNWLRRGNAHCPLTRKELRPNMLIPNSALKIEIQNWKRKQPDYCGEEEKYESWSTMMIDRRTNFIGLLCVPPKDSIASLQASSYYSTREGPPQDAALEEILTLYENALHGPNDHLPSSITTRPPFRGSSTTPSVTALLRRKQEEGEESVLPAVQDTRVLHSMRDGAAHRKRWRPTNMFKKKRVV